MIIQGGATLNPSAGLSRATFQQQTAYTPAPQQQQPKEDLTRRFDSVTISENGGADPVLSLKSRLSREVRTAMSTDRIASLREQIRSGEYQPDPREIARKMLLTGEAE